MIAPSFTWWVPFSLFYMVSSIAPAFLYISTVDLELLVQLLLVHCAEVDLIRPKSSSSSQSRVGWRREGSSGRRSCSWRWWCWGCWDDLASGLCIITFVYYHVHICNAIFSKSTIRISVIIVICWISVFRFPMNPLFNRLSVAGAVLQSPPSLTDWFTD